MEHYTRSVGITPDQNGCNAYNALVRVDSVSGHYTRSERVQCLLIGCTPSSATSSIADALPRRNGHHD